MRDPRRGHSLERLRNSSDQGPGAIVVRRIVNLDLYSDVKTIVKHWSLRTFIHFIGIFGSQASIGEHMLPGVSVRMLVFRAPAGGDAY